jgi:hypothetical protein
MIKLKKMRWMGHVPHMGDTMRNAHKIFARKSEGKRSLIRPRHRWEYNMEVNLKEIGWEGVE